MNSKLSKFLGVAIVAVCTVIAFYKVSAQTPAAALEKDHVTIQAEGSVVTPEECSEEAPSVEAPEEEAPSVEAPEEEAPVANQAE